MSLFKRLKNLWKLSAVELDVPPVINVHNVPKLFESLLIKEKMAKILEEDKPEMFPNQEEEI